MRPVIAAVCVLAAMLSLAYGTEYKVLEMPDATPYKEISCPKDCTDPMSKGMKKVSEVLNGVMNHQKFKVSFCSECYVANLGGFTFTDECFMDSEENPTVFDHHLHMVFPKASGNCTCPLPNSPSKAAEKINEAESPKGNCGSKGHQNQLKRDTITCDDKEEVDGISVISLLSDLEGLIIDAVLRVDTLENPENNEKHTYPISVTLTTDHDEPIKFEDDSNGKFGKAQECLTKNKEPFFSHLFAGALTPFFDCMNDNVDEYGSPEVSPVHSILFEYAKCNSRK